MGGGRQQAIVFRFDDLVALTDLCFQSLPVQYGYVATVIIDESRLLQFPCGLRDPFAADAQHIGDHFLRDRQFVRREPVQALQQPAAELLDYRMMPVADRRLRHLGDQGLYVMQ